MKSINTKSDAYNTGFEARLQSEPVSANPYLVGTFESDNWLAGWSAAA